MNMIFIHQYNDPFAVEVKKRLKVTSGILYV